MLTLKKNLYNSRFSYDFSQKIFRVVYLFMYFFPSSLHLAVILFSPPTLFYHCVLSFSFKRSISCSTTNFLTFENILNETIYLKSKSSHLQMTENLPYLAFWIWVTAFKMLCPVSSIHLQILWFIFTYKLNYVNILHLC